MAEDSLLWTTTAGLGDGPIGGYTQQNWLDFHRYIFNPDLEATAGVLPRKGNTLACTGTASPVAVNTGAAFVYGFFYKNTASLNLTVSTPTLGTTGFRVVLRASWAAATVRAAILSSANGVAAIPAVTQSAGTTWEITLATGTITNGGVITLTDARVYLQMATLVTGNMLDSGIVDSATIEINSNVLRVKDAGITSAKLRNSNALSIIGRSTNSSGVPADIAASAASGAVLRESGSTIGFGTVATAGIANDAIDDTKVGNRVVQFIRRVGGSATRWSTAGTSNYTPTTIYEQAGISSIVLNAGVATGSVTITYNVAFAEEPLIQLTLQGVTLGHVQAEPTIYAISSDTQLTIAINRIGTGTGYTYTISWRAVGPQ